MPIYTLFILKSNHLVIGFRHRNDLTILFVVKGLEFHRLLVDPRTTALQGDRVIKLRIEREHVQLHLLTINGFLRVQHILNQLTIRCTRRMNADNPLRFILTLLIRSLFLLILLVAIQRSESSLISSLYRS